MTYLWLKVIHVVSSTLLFGTGLGIAFFMWRAHRGGNPAVVGYFLLRTREVAQ